MDLVKEWLVFKCASKYCKVKLYYEDVQRKYGKITSKPRFTMHKCSLDGTWNGLYTMYDLEENLDTFYVDALYYSSRTKDLMTQIESAAVHSSSKENQCLWNF